MKTKILFLLKNFLFLFILFAMEFSRAESIPFSKAVEYAQKFYNLQFSTNSTKTNSEFLSFTCIYPNTASQKKAVTDYYIFNVGQNQGFVIIAGDDAINPVLAYSGSGRFSVENMPNNLKYWLNQYTMWVQQAQTKKLSNNDSAISKINAFPKTKSSIVVNPLLKTIQYDQMHPYHLLCPSDKGGDHYPTGCVATALAQIAKFYQYPSQGKESITYITETLKLKLTTNFSEHTYDWANMLTDYQSQSNYTPTQSTAIATLMRDIGYASKMDYDQDASGAYDLDALYGMIRFLNYDVASLFLTRDFYNIEEWTALIKDNLDNQHPLYYSGAGDLGAHAFVCDGYDDAGFFHFNWGWGGSSNGYFVLDHLDPPSLGTGGGSGGFNRNQGIFHHFYPAQTASVAPSLLRMENDLLYSMGRYNLTSNFSTKFTFSNYSPQIFNGPIALALYENGKFLHLISDSIPITALDPYYGYDKYSLNFCNVHSISPGFYNAYVVYKANEGKDWIPMKTNLPYRNYIPIFVDSNSYYLSAPFSKVKIQVKTDGTSLANANVLLSNTDQQYSSSVTDTNHPVLLDSVKAGIYVLQVSFPSYKTEIDTVSIAGDTSFTISLLPKHRISPTIVSTSIDSNQVKMTWKITAASEANAPICSGFAIYLNNKKIKEVEANVFSYVFTKLPVGKHCIGLTAIYPDGESSLVTENIEIKPVTPPDPPAKPAPIHLQVLVQDSSALFSFSTTEGFHPSFYTIYLNNALIKDSLVGTSYLFPPLKAGKYIAGVKAIYPYGVSDLATTNFEIKRTANGIREKNIYCKIYPNPSSNGLFYLQIDREYEMEIISREGLRIKTQKFPCSGIYTFDLSAYSSGVYFIHLRHKQEVITLKAVLAPMETK
ncbi:MAG: C10 family peptidase [Bacteroidales bacterium]